MTRCPSNAAITVRQSLAGALVLTLLALACAACGKAAKEAPRGVAVSHPGAEERPATARSPEQQPATPVTDSPWSPRLAALRAALTDADPAARSAAVVDLEATARELATEMEQRPDPRIVGALLELVTLTRDSAEAGGSPTSVESIAAAARRTLAVLPDAYRNPYGQAILPLLARAATDHGRLDPARRILEAAANDYASDGLPVGVVLELIEVLRVQGSYEEARRHMDLVDAALAAQRRDPPETADSLRQQIQALLTHAKLDLAIGWIDHAYARAEQAQQLAERLGDAGYSTVVTRHLAELAIATDNADYAIRLLDAVQSPGNEPDAAPRSVDDARSALLSGIARSVAATLDPAAIPDAARRIDIATASGLLPPLDLFVAAEIRAELAIAARDNAKALQYLAEARLRLSDVAATTGVDSPTFATSAAQLSSLAAAASALGPADADRDRALLDRLRHDYDRFLDAWGSLPIVPGGIGFLHFSDTRRVLSELITLTLRTEPTETAGRLAFQEVLKAHAQGSLARELDLPTGTAAEIQQRLVPADGLLLAFVPGPLVTHVFALDGQTIAVHAGGGKEILEQRLKRFVGLVSKRPGATDIDNSRQRIAVLGSEILKELLPDELRQRLRGVRRLCVTGTDLLCHLPVECLTLDGQTLGISHAVSNLPSLTVGLALASRPSTATRGDLCFLGAPDTPDPRFQLVLSADDKDRLLEPLHPARGMPVIGWIGAEGFAQRFAAPELRDCPLLHVLAHGVYLPDEPMPQGLRLAAEPKTARGSPAAADGILSSTRLAELLMASPRIVVLSACGSARGPERRGEDGYDHLGGIFLRKGADCVILSRHDIDFRATVELIVAFQRELRAGHCPIDALQLARRTIAGQFDHPYYHSLLRVLGLGQRPID